MRKYIRRFINPFVGYTINYNKNADKIYVYRCSQYFGIIFYKTIWICENDYELNYILYFLKIRK